MHSPNVSVPVIASTPNIDDNNIELYSAKPMKEDAAATLRSFNKHIKVSNSII